MIVHSYAPFCKHLFVENFTDTRVNMVPITQANARLLLSDYEARVPGELPVYVLSAFSRRLRRVSLWR